MPPEPFPSTFPDVPDPLDLLDGAVWGLLGEAALPPMAGGQLPGFLEDAWGWTTGNLLDPGGDFLRDALAEIGRTVSGAVTTILSWLLKWVYHITRFSLWYAVPQGHRLRFPSVFDESTQSPYEYLSRILRILGSVVEGVVGPAVLWVAGELWFWTKWIAEQAAGGVTWLAGELWFWTKWIAEQAAGGVTWLAGELWFWSKWVADQAAGGVTWLAGEVWSGAEWVAEQGAGQISWLWGETWFWLKWVAEEAAGGIAWLAGELWFWSKWVADQVQAGNQWIYDNVLEKIPEGIVAGAAEIGKLIREAFEWFVDSAFEPFVDVLQSKFAIPGKLLRGEYTSVEALMDDLMDPPNELLRGLTLIALTPAYLIIGLLLAFFPPYRPILNKLEWEVAANVGGTLPTFQMLRDGLRRELLAVDEHDEWLRKGGYTGALVELQRELYEEIPGSGDLVRMGVREVFTPEIAERFGQFEDFPPAFGEWMAKQGYTDFWAKAFWGAHWDLPSVTQGFQMFHRGVIPPEELELLLRALDVMPYWREKLTDIAYRVITRVDVRRMYAEGVFDRDQVLRVYKDLGYKPEDAEDLTEFVVRRYPPKGAETADDLRSVTVNTIKQAYARRLVTQDDVLEGLQELEYGPEDAQLIVSIWEFDWTQDPSLRSDVDPKGVARSVIEKAYERRLFDLNAGVRELGELGYTPEDAHLLLQLVDLRLEEQLADLEIDGLVSDYQDGVISDGQLAAALEDLHVPQGRVDFLLRREILSRQAKRRRLSLSQMKKAVAADLMEVGEYRARLGVMGYNAVDVEILTALNVEDV